MKSKTKWKVGKRGRDKRRKEGGRQEAREEGEKVVGIKRDNPYEVLK